MYLAHTSTLSKSDVWLIESCTSFHMTPHWEWLSKYENYNGGDVFLGHESIVKIMECGRVKLVLKDRRIRTIRSVLHILDLERNLIYVNKMSDSGV